MLSIIAPLAIAVSPLTATAQDNLPELSLEHRMLARCSAAFALVAEGQSNGNAAALRYPDIRESGSEFFVQAGARLMDEAGLSREQLTVLFSSEAQDLWDNDTLDDVMPACLALLDN
ncbi:hypothetical protein [Aurantiacibacter sp. MUD61]|uniref:hypothetical protein n=1 Tax=Aurantiacibacter sp. MUD61 TaxID=3009083 RepID=UPI0022F08B3F|nr:hypothetical protein [Aurantiacibacter sp. MUD61]